MNLKSLLAALVLFSVSLCSQAGVIYEWHGTNNETPRGITLQLEFDEAIVASGRLGYSVHQMFPDDPLPESKWFSVRYSHPGEGGPRFLSFDSDSGFENGLGILEIDVRFGPGGFLSGLISVGDNEKSISLASVGRLFTVLDARSDEGMDWAGCDWGSECAGATGHIRSAEIPEPHTLALLGAGLLGLALRRKAGSRGGQVRAA